MDNHHDRYIFVEEKIREALVETNRIGDKFLSYLLEMVLIEVMSEEDGGQKDAEFVEFGK